MTPDILTEGEVVNMPLCLPRYVKNAVYGKVKAGKRSEYITSLIKKDLGLE